MKPLFSKYFGLVYNLLSVLLSWGILLLLRRVLLDSSVTAMVSPSAGSANGPAVAVIVLAVLLEMVAITLKVRQTRYALFLEAKGKAGLPAPYVPEDTSDFPFLVKLMTLCARGLFSGMIGVSLGALAGSPAAGGVLGLALIVKDIVFFNAVTRDLDKPMETLVPAWQRRLANLLLTVVGLTGLMVGWIAFMSVMGPHLATCRHWTGFGDWFISALLLVIFYFVLAFPARIGFHLEEMTLADTPEESRALQRSMLVSMLLTILPWLV
ncbi:MAG: hypothetical protein CVU65_12825 [Deltaproteobacteria bacterium HGW-Deltaproteobacteria-22]|jgi:hypothetical protein|nr:MAG: hypothetical protein CVU65_12825 [Deltaproteobacteria bacterium HGW-Deltaproteobacteria-22]